MNTETDRDLRVKVSEALSFILKSPAQLISLPEEEILAKVLELFKIINVTCTRDQVSFIVRSQVGEMKDALSAMANASAKSRSSDWIPEHVTRDSGMLSAYLKNLSKQAWDPADIRRLRMSVLSTLGAIGNPTRPECTFGLIVGRVQSGKTTHYVALILAALAAGYRRILVLGGHTNSLRAQCQRRLQRAFHSMTPDGVAFSTPEFCTSDQEDGDLTVRKAISKNPEGAQVFVCKKNTTPLKTFLETFGSSPLSLLVIDDEADWGTQNVAGDPEQEQTKINKLITNIIDEHPARSSHRAYIAYTATPYANLLVSEADAGAIMPQYVKVISPGRGYLGNDEIVGNDDGDESEILPLFVKRRRSDPSRGGLSNIDTNKEFRLDLEDAVVHYFLAAAAYRAICSSDQGTTRVRRAKMLVNDSTLKDPQAVIGRLISNVVKTITRDILIDDESRLSSLERLWTKCYVTNWTRFAERLEDITVAPPIWSCMKEHLVDVANALTPYGQQDQHVRIINSDNDAWTAAETADRDTEMIYVGGLVFARGVTIDGLTTVLFAAPPGQQDTLLQYARWLGYRGNFAPLLRVLLPSADKDAYTAIARLDRELWHFLKSACDQKMSPADAKIVVPRDSQGSISRPTSASKTRLAVMTLESRMIGPVTWETGSIDPSQFDLWNAAGLRLLSKSSLIEEHDDAISWQLYDAESNIVLDYLLSISETNGSTGERMNHLAEGIRRNEEAERNRTHWIIACPIRDQLDAWKGADGDVSDLLQRQIGKNPRIAERTVKLKDALVSRSGGSFSGVPDRTVDFKHRITDRKGFELAADALEKSFSRQDGSIWHSGEKPAYATISNSLNSANIDSAKSALIGSLRQDLQSAAKGKTWDRWLRRPGDAFCVIQVFSLTVDTDNESQLPNVLEPKVLPRVLLPAIVTPRSASPTYGMVPRERVRDNQ